MSASWFGNLNQSYFQFFFGSYEQSENGVSESLSANDLSSATVIFQTSINETLSAQTTEIGQLYFEFSVSEALNISDQQSTSQDNQVNEVLSCQDNIDATVDSETVVSFGGNGGGGLTTSYKFEKNRFVPIGRDDLELVLPSLYVAKIKATKIYTKAKAKATLGRSFSSKKILAFSLELSAKNIHTILYTKNNRNVFTTKVRVNTSTVCFSKSSKQTFVKKQVKIFVTKKSKTDKLIAQIKQKTRSKTNCFTKCNKVVKRINTTKITGNHSVEFSDEDLQIISLAQKVYFESFDE